MPQFETRVAATESKPKLIAHPAFHMTGILVNILKAHFARADKNVFKAVSDKVYKDDPATNRILIGGVDVFDGRETGRRPAIIVKKGSTQWTRMGIAEYRDLGNIKHGDEFSTLHVSSATLFALSTVADEAELLALSAADQLHQFQHQIRKQLPALKRFRVLSVAEVGRLKEAPTLFAVPVAIGYAYEQPYKVFGELAPFRFVQTEATYE